ncbi:MAG: hypothetical protein H6732_06890 [Alphaproteobacteria bacterium]|nr:hypothetical protein [Alphaproteobacteria bacterium]
MRLSLQDAELAREARLWDGAALWCEGRAAGCVYLLGIHAELCLKTAYFRFRDEPPATPLDRALLATTAARAVLLGVRASHQGFHSLRFWSEILVAERRAARRPLSPRVEASLGECVELLARHWSIDLRYAAPHTPVAVVERVVAGVDWLDRHHRALHA